MRHLREMGGDEWACWSALTTLGAASLALILILIKDTSKRQRTRFTGNSDFHSAKNPQIPSQLLSQEQSQSSGVENINPEGTPEAQPEHFEHATPERQSPLSQASTPSSIGDQSPGSSFSSQSSSNLGASDTLIAKVAEAFPPTSVPASSSVPSPAPLSSPEPHSSFLTSASAREASIPPLPDGELKNLGMSTENFNLLGLEQLPARSDGSEGSMFFKIDHSKANDNEQITASFHSLYRREPQRCDTVYFYNGSNKVWKKRVYNGFSWCPAVAIK